MKRLALATLLSVSTPALAADLYPYPERDVVIERPAPPTVVERERIIERRYYEAAPAYTARKVYVEPYYSAPRVYAPEVVYERPYAYAYTGWRPRHFFPRGIFWHRHHRDW